MPTRSALDEKFFVFYGGGVCIADKLYVLGGSDGQEALSSVEILDLLELCWSPGPAMTVPRANVSAVVLQGRVYAVGGFNGKAFLSSIEYLDAGRAPVLRLESTVVFDIFLVTILTQ